IHDILLSRKHCRLEPSADGRWTVSDLGSKNGTFVDERRVERHALGDGEVIQVGKTRITFHTGSFIPPPRSFNHPRPARPVDPQEALAGTVAGAGVHRTATGGDVAFRPAPPAAAAARPGRLRGGRSLFDAG